MFNYDGHAWLIARKNVTEDGCFDLGFDSDDYSHQQQFVAYSGQYWQSPKRCTLWYVNDETLSVDPILDFPSAGDTCFASILGENGDFEIWNYTSDPEFADISWLEGQQGKTQITRQPLLFTQTKL